MNYTNVKTAILNFQNIQKISKNSQNAQNFFIAINYSKSV